MNTTRYFNITLAFGLTATISASAEQLALLALDNQKSNFAYLIESSRILTENEIFTLRSALQSQNLSLIEKSKNQNLLNPKNIKYRANNSVDTFDLINHIRDIVGIETNVSEVDLRFMQCSTQEEISSH